MMLLPSDTWPSPPITTLPLRRTERMVVPRYCSNVLFLTSNLRSVSVFILFWGRRELFQWRRGIYRDLILDPQPGPVLPASLLASYPMGELFIIPQAKFFPSAE